MLLVFSINLVKFVTLKPTTTTLWLWGWMEYAHSAHQLLHQDRPSSPGAKLMWNHGRHYVSSSS